MFTESAPVLRRALNAERRSTGRANEDAAPAAESRGTPRTGNRRSPVRPSRPEPVQPMADDHPLRTETRNSPHLRANPCPEVTDRFCRLPLPTLFYRPEAVNLGDLLRIRVRPGVRITLPPSHFQGPTPMHRTPREARRFTDATTLSLNDSFPGCPLLTKKRELSPGSTSASASSVALPRWDPRVPSPQPGSGMLTRFPFDRVRELISASVRSARGRRRGHLAAALPCCVVATAVGPVQNGPSQSLRTD